MTGDYKKTINFEFDNISDCQNIQYFNGIIYTDFFEDNNNSKNESLIQCVDLSTGKQKATFLNSRINNKGWNNPNFTVEIGCFVPMIEASYLFRSMFMDTIFSITSHGLLPYIAINSKDLISENSLNNEIDYRMNPSQLGNFFISLKRSNIIFTIYSYFIRNDIVFFKYLKGNRDFSVLFDAKTNKTQIYKTINNDLLFKHSSQIPFKVSFFDKTGVFCHLNINSLPKFLEILNSNSLNDISKEQLKGLNIESNPVIFYYEFK